MQEAAEPRSGANETWQSPTDPGERGLGDLAWSLFCSTRLALYLILAVVVASLAGALLIQVPAGLTAAEYSQWLNQIRPRFGISTDAFSLLGLFDVFRVWWFRLLLGLLTLSVVICSLDRWPRAWRAIRNPSARAQDVVFAKAANRASFWKEDLTPVEAAKTAEGILRGRGYRVRREEDPGTIHLYADRNWFGRLGTFLNHFGLVLILAGSVAGGVWGFRDRDFAIPEGSTRQVGHDTKLSMRVESFVDEYYPEGPPKDYRSEVVLYDDGVEVKRGTIRVNEPMAYDGIRFYQSFFGPAVVLQIKTSDGNLIYDDGVALAWRSTVGQRPVGTVSLPGQGLSVQVVGPSSANRAPDAQIPAGTVLVQTYRTGSNSAEATELLRAGQPKRIGNLEYLFVRERQFTGFQVVRDPGSPVIWVASTLMVLGLMLAFYFPHRRLWARVAQETEGQTSMMLAAPSSRAFSFAREFRELAEEITSEIETERADEAESSAAEPATRQ